MKLYGKKCYNYLLNFSLSPSVASHSSLLLSSSLRLSLSSLATTNLPPSAIDLLHHATDLTIFLSHKLSIWPSFSATPPIALLLRHVAISLASFFCGFSFVVVGWFWWLWWLILGGCGPILVVMVTVVGSGWIDFGFGLQWLVVIGWFWVVVGLW